MYVFESTADPSIVHLCLKSPAFCLFPHTVSMTLWCMCVAVAITLPPTPPLALTVPRCLHVLRHTPPWLQRVTADPPHAESGREAPYRNALVLV